LLESAIVQSIFKYLSSRPRSFTVKLHGSRYQKRGLPDILHISEDLPRSVWFEVKRPGKSATVLQQHRAREIGNAGGYAFTVTSVQEVSDAIQFVVSDLG